MHVAHRSGFAGALALGVATAFALAASPAQSVTRTTKKTTPRTAAPSTTTAARPTTPATAVTPATPASAPASVPLTLPVTTLPVSAGPKDLGWPLKAPTPKLPVNFRDELNNRVTITDISRIASLQGDITEVLWTLGLGDNIVVVDSTGLYPAEMQKRPQAGFFRTLSAEGILSQRPTVVLAHPEAGPPAVLDAVRRAGVPVVILPTLNGSNPREAAEKVRIISEAMGMPDHGDKLARQVDQLVTEGVAEAARLAKGKPSPVLAYIVPRGTSVFLTGMDSPSNAIIEAANATPAAKMLKLAVAAPLTPEALINANPDYIVSTFTAVQQGGGKDAFLALQGIAQTKAGRNKALLVYDDDFIQQFVPRTGLAIQLVARDLYGKS